MIIDSDNTEYKHIFEYLLKYSHNVSIEVCKNEVIIDDLDIGIYLFSKNVQYEIKKIHFKIYKPYITMVSLIKNFGCTAERRYNGGLENFVEIFEKYFDIKKLDILTVDEVIVKDIIE